MICYCFDLTSYADVTYCSIKKTEAAKTVSDCTLCRRYSQQGLTNIHRKCLSYSSIHQVYRKLLVMHFSNNIKKCLKKYMN